MMTIETISTCVGCWSFWPFTTSALVEVVSDSDSMFPS